ncbi:MFS general substrate transporter [Aspergillus bertholletiae]|uniref:MFS general substrate transporter n=1 Tax=Aspergillus bertholletiae TaxID=1226010 RepID=A0A5N7BPL9_9EURO|nr:MFS general substrate transporter [Aspergillus bertholletiae]
MAVQRNSVELQSQPETALFGLEPSDEVSQSLGPVDQGRQAWTVLIAGVTFEAIFWGFPMAFGVFQNYYSTIPEFQKDNSKIPFVGTLAQSLYYLGAPFSAILTRRFPKYQRQQIWLGWPLCILGLLSASFTTSVNGLIGTQGLLYGLGFVLLSYPIVSMVNEWWIARKGMAFGLISASSGITGAFLPFIIEALLGRYGYKTTLRACAVAMTILTAPLIPLFKGRLPASESFAFARTNWSFLKRPLFWVYALSILGQGFGFFFPAVFLPSYAAALNIPSIKGALLLALMCIAQVLGQFTFGYLSDKTFSVNSLSIVCCVAAAVAAFVFWGLAKSITFLVVFSLLHGFFSFGFGTLRVAMGRAVSEDQATIFATYALFVFLQGVGNILVSPISAALIVGPPMHERFGVEKYSGVVILTGASSALAGLIIALWLGCRMLARAHSDRGPCRH